MANTPISGFPSGAPAQSGDQVVIARAGANYSLLNSDLKTLIVGAGSVSIASGKTLAANNSLTLAGTDGTTMTFPSASGTVATLNAANLFTKANTFQPDSDAQAGTFRRNSSGQTANIVEIQTEANAFLAAFDKTGALTIGAASGNTGALKLKGTTSGTVTLSTADAAGTWTMKLPTSGGTNNYLLATDGSGNTSWVAPPSTTLTVGSTATSGGAAGQLMFDTGSVLSESSSLVWDNTNKLLTATGLGTGGGANTGGITVSGGALTLSGNISANAWTTSGIRYKSVAATLTDLTSTGTVAAAYTNVYGDNTIAASNSTTFTDYFTTFITQPTAGTNVTFTNRWALGLSGNLKVSGGTVTASTPLLDLSQEWSNSGITFTGMLFNVTDTASANNSLLVNIRTTARNNVFAIRKSSATAWQLMLDGVPRIYSNQSNDTFLCNAGFVGANGFGFIGSQIRIRGDGSFAFSATDPSAAADTILSRGGAAATFQLGAADATTNAAIVAQILQVQSVASGGAGDPADQAGKNFTINGSRGTGTGAGGSIIFQVAPAGTTGKTPNALATALTIDSTKKATFAAAVAATSLDLTANAYITIPSGYVNINVNGNWGVTYQNDELRFANINGILGWSGTGSNNASDVRLQRDGVAGALGQRSGTTAQTFNIYNTYTSSTNYERAGLYWSSNVFYIAGQKGSGGGTLRGVSLGSAATDLISFYGATPIVQPTTAVAAATVASTGTGDVVAASTTFDGYTIPQIVKALRNAGLLA